MLRPSLTCDFYGFDVYDRPSDNFGGVVRKLAERAPDTPWAQRLIRIPA